MLTYKYEFDSKKTEIKVMNIKLQNSYRYLKRTFKISAAIG